MKTLLPSILKIRKHHLSTGCFINWAAFLSIAKLIAPCFHWSGIPFEDHLKIFFEFRNLMWRIGSLKIQWRKWFKSTNKFSKEPIIITWWSGTSWSFLTSFWLVNLRISIPPNMKSIWNILTSFYGLIFPPHIYLLIPILVTWSFDSWGNVVLIAFYSLLKRG